MASQPAQSSGGHRGLYMVLGSIVTIGILVAAGLYLPKLWKTSASGSPTRTTQTEATPKPAPIITPAPVTPAPVVSETTTPVNPLTTPKPVKELAPQPPRLAPSAETRLCWKRRWPPG